MVGGLLTAFNFPSLSLTIIGQPQGRVDSSSARRKLLRRLARWKEAWSAHVVAEWGYLCFLSQACAHRWKNVYYDSEHILPHGYCSIIPPTLQGRTMPLIPCYEGTQSRASQCLQMKMNEDKIWKVWCASAPLCLVVGSNKLSQSICRLHWITSIVGFRLGLKSVQYD